MASAIRARRSSPEEGVVCVDTYRKEDALGIFVRFLVRKAITQFLEHELEAFTAGSFVEGDLGGAASVAFYRLSVIFEHTLPSAQTDRGQVDLHFVNTSPDNLGVNTDATAMAAVETAFDTFWGSIKVQASPSWGLKEYRWYRQTLSDPLSGPPVRVTTKGSSVVGTFGGDGAAQLACNVTLRTALRRYWGRIALPLISGNATGGVLSATSVDNVANGFRTFALACQTATLTPCVWSKAKEALLSISDIEVDNLPDIQRRRRPKRSTYQKILSA